MKKAMRSVAVLLVVLFGSAGCVDVLAAIGRSIGAQVAVGTIGGLLRKPKPAVVTKEENKVTRVTVDEESILVH